MTNVPSTGVDNNPELALSGDQQAVLTASAITPEWALGEGLVMPRGCDLSFPSLGGAVGGIVRSCQPCRDRDRPKYYGPGGFTPQPTVVHDAGPGSLLVYVEGVLKALAAAQAVQSAGLPWTVVFINGSDGIGRKTARVVGSQARGRDVVVVFDADLETNHDVASSAVRVESELRRAEATSVRFARVPRVADDAHTGLDDHLAATDPDHRADALVSLVDDSPSDLLVADVFDAHAAGLDETGRLSLARTVAERVCSLGLGEAWTQEWRARLKSVCKLPQGDFDKIRRSTETGLKTGARDRAHRKITSQGLEMPSPNEPLEVAHQLLQQNETLSTRVRIWRGDWYGWTGTHWSPYPVTSLTDRLRKDLRHAWYMSGGKEPAPTPWAPTSSKIGEVVDALASVLRRPDHQEPDGGVFTLGGRVGMDGTVTGHTPETFNLTCLPYAYDPSATAPQWDEFLRQSLPAEDDRALLQEVFGYLVSGETDQQKIFLLAGPPRAGKGTVLRVLQQLIGSDAHTATQLSTLGTHFGRASLIGKSVAFMSDVRFNTSGAAEAVTPLLNISGEDSVPVPRKNRDDWVGTLPTRIVMASNDMPVLPDSSGALYSRLVAVQFTQSFTGREDYGLTGRLLTERPGIFNWALAGYARLKERGRFIGSAGGRELAEAARRDASPVSAFLDDVCEAEEGAFISSHDLFMHWEAYRQDQNYTRKDLSKPGLSRAVLGSVPGTSSQVRKVNGKAVRGIAGLRLKSC